VPLPDDVDARMLDPEARTELRSLAKDTADLVARHLVMAGRLVDEDPTTALTHARAARALAGRVGAVREAAGLTAYLAGEWADALSELRTARRITGRPDHVHVMADCERALQRPERALAYGDDPAVPTLAQETRVELVIVLSGARQDLGQPEAAVVLLQDPARRTTAKRPWAARLWYAYADALLAADREDEAREWFSRTAEVDVDGDTDAAERLLELDGVILENPDEDDLPEDGEGGGEQARPVDLAALAASISPPAADSDAPTLGASVPDVTALDPAPDATPDEPPNEAAALPGTAPLFLAAGSATGPGEGAEPTPADDAGPDDLTLFD
jgi:hypothetical protein